MTRREIPLTQSQVALVDEEDYELVSQFKWHAKWDSCTHKFYAARTVREAGKQQTIFMHNFLMGGKTDHSNHNTLDNQRSNLRLATFSQNAGNRRMRKDNVSGYKGVHWRSRRGGKWEAEITCDKKTKFLGSFANPIDAAKAYDAAARELFGEYACVNFPERNNQI